MNNEARDIHDEEKINNVSEGCGESPRFPAARNVGWWQLTDRLFYRHYSQLENNDLPKNMPPSFGQLISLGWLVQGIKTQPLAWFGVRYPNSVELSVELLVASVIKVQVFNSSFWLLLFLFLPLSFGNEGCFPVKVLHIKFYFRGSFPGETYLGQFVPEMMLEITH